MYNYMILAFISFFLTVGIKVDSKLSADLKERYVTTRFSVENDAWPPEQPKEYTTLALIHHKNQPTQKQVIALAKAKGAGKVESIIAATGGQPFPSGSNEAKALAECFKESKSTRNIADILVPLDDPNEKLPRTILIEGAPGLGKTVLLKQIAYEWAQSKQLIKSQFVFLLLLRDPTVQAMSSITDLVRYFYMQSEICKICVDLISEANGRNVTFLLDGYDELPMQERKYSFISKIINHEILPFSAVVISSRPHASTSLRNNSLCQVDILGFSPDDQLMFFKNALKGQPGKLQHLQSYLDIHPTISSLCYIPFNMTVLLWLFKQGIPLPNSSAALYNCFICHAIRSHLTKHNVTIDTITDLNSLPQPYKVIIQQLSVLCLKSLETSELVFSLQDIKSACPEIETFPGAINGFGLLQTVEHYSQDPKFLGAPTKTLNFIHFSIQEYLAAYQITCLPPKKELQFIQTNFFSEFYTNTFALYVGLTKGQRPCFKKFLSSYGKNIISSFFSTNTNKIASKFLEDDRKSLRLFQCFYEADDQESCSSITEKMCKYKELSLQNGVSTMPLLPGDVQCLALFLRMSSNKYWWNLYLSECHIGDAGLRMLHQSLVDCGVTIDNIGLSFNSLTSQSSDLITEIASSCKTKHLSIFNNRVTDGLDLLKNSTLEKLALSNNKLSSSGANRLFSSLARNKNVKLKVIWVDNNSIGDEAVSSIVELLVVNSVLEQLDISSNMFSEGAVLTIMQSLVENKTLKKLKISLGDFAKLEPHITMLKESINSKRDNESKLQITATFL